MIKLAKVHEVELEDGRTAYFKDATIAIANDLLAFEASQGKDLVSLCGVLKAVLVEKDGKPLKEISGYKTKEDLAADLPMAEAMMLFNAYSEVVQAGNEETPAG